MNTKLLRKVQKQILKEPRQFHMQEWFSRYVPWEIPNCGTAACIGGWAVCLATKSTPGDLTRLWRDTIDPDKVLDLSGEEGDRLFLESQWPARFKGGKTPEIRAERAAKRIDHFIKTRGMQ